MTKVLSSSFQLKSTAQYGIDLLIYLSILFLSRQIQIEVLGYMWSAVLSSFIALAAASLIMKRRKVSWKDLGMAKPINIWKTLAMGIATVLVVVLCLIGFEILKDLMGWQFSPSGQNDVKRFGELQNNLPLFFSILPIVWLESALEEMIDRGFLLTWIERLFSFTHLKTILAVLLQALLFGFRHSNDISERSITVAIIGLIMGLAYVLSGRSLWPVIIAHILLNSFSMLERVY